MKYEIFFKEIKKFKDKQNEQKQRGLNNFNLLTTVRKYHDEVYLHSAMIGAFLDPRGEHYQKTLFLENFLNVIGLDNWGLNLENATVAIEYKNIDLYITDGIKHIIIENKIFAEDQSCQLTKYINIIVDENKDTFKNIGEDNKLSDELLRVVYLTAQSKDLPNEHKLLKDDYISFDGTPEKLVECSNRDTTKKLVVSGLKNYKAKYQKISYQKEIIQWLQLSKKEIENITNLNEAFRQYIDVVQMVNKNYKGKVMALEELLKDEQLFLLAKEVSNAYLKALEKKVEENKEVFFNALKEQLALNNIEQLKEPRILIPITTLDGGVLKLQIIYERNELLATLFKDINGWYLGNYEDNEKISELIKSTQGMRRIGKYGYFSINLNANVNFEKPVDKQEIDKTRDNVSNLLAKLREMDLK